MAKGSRQVSCLLLDASEKGAPVPYMTITRFCGEPERLLREYRRSARVMDRVGREHGLMLHAGARDEQGLVVVNLWPSHDESEAAARDPRRLAELDRVRDAIDRLEREHYQLDHFLSTIGTRVG